MVLDLRKLRNDIAELDAISVPTDIGIVITLIIACKKSEFDNTSEG